MTNDKMVEWAMNVSMYDPLWELSLGVLRLVTDNGLLRAQVLAQARRIADQSELLSRRAEKEKFDGSTGLSRTVAGRKFESQFG